MSRKKFDIYRRVINPYSQFCERYATLRIDIKSINKNNGTLFIKNCVPTPLSIKKPEWLQKWKNSGDGFIISSSSGEISFNMFYLLKIVNL